MAERWRPIARRPDLKPRTTQTFSEILRDPIVVVVGVCAIALTMGFLFKGQCLQPWDGRQYARGCYNDIQPLYGIRLFADRNQDGITERVSPYVDGRLENGELKDGGIEYPVLTGVFMWFSGIFAQDSNSYLRISALLLAPFGIMAAYLLARMAAWRALMWAAAPALVLYAFHNWDLLVVAAAVTGFWFWSRGRPIAAAVAFGIGAALKMYPLLFVVPLAAEAWQRQDRRTAVRVLAAGAGGFLAVNLPFMLAGFEGWSATYEFHRLRGPNFDNIWQWPQFGLPAMSPQTLNLVTALLTGIFLVVALRIGLVTARREGRYPFIPVCAAFLAAFMLFSKVHSPQYALWILPFFVLLRVHWAWWAAYSVVDLIVYWGTFRFFYDSSILQIQEPLFARGSMVFGVWIRAALLVVLFFVFLRSRSVVEMTEPSPAEPAPARARPAPATS